MKRKLSDWIISNHPNYYLTIGWLCVTIVFVYGTQTPFGDVQAVAVLLGLLLMLFAFFAGLYSVAHRQYLEQERNKMRRAITPVEYNKGGTVE